MNPLTQFKRIRILPLLIAPTLIVGALQAPAASAHGGGASAEEGGAEGTERGQGAPLDEGLGVPGRHVAGDDGEVVGDAAVRHGDAGAAVVGFSRDARRRR